MIYYQNSTMLFSNMHKFYPFSMFYYKLSVLFVSIYVHMYVTIFSINNNFFVGDVSVNNLHVIAEIY